MPPPGGQARFYAGGGRGGRPYNGAMDTAALIHAYYAAFNRGDREGMLALLTDDVAHDLNQGARETGREAFRAFMARMDRCYAEELRDIVVMAEIGRASCRERGEGAVGGRS